MQATATNVLKGPPISEPVPLQREEWLWRGFSAQMPGRVYEGGYRYGYHGSEKDDEIKGSGNSYTTFCRLLDTRIGRWFSIDPKVIASETPYCAMHNNPLLYNDELGDTIKFAPGSRIIFKIRIITALAVLYMIDNGCRKQIKDLNKSSNSHTFIESLVSVVMPVTSTQWRDNRNRVVNDFDLSTRVFWLNYEDMWTGTISPENQKAYELAVSNQRSAVNQLWNDITATAPSIWPHQNEERDAQIGDGSTIDINLKERPKSLISLIAYELRHAWDCDKGKLKTTLKNGDAIISERSKYVNYPEMRAVNQENRVISKINKTRVFRSKIEQR